MGKVTADHLMQRQSLPLSAKVAFTQSRVRSWYEHWQGQVYVSYSGGKDSTVLLDIVRRIYPDVPAVFSDTGLEYPEVRELALRNADVVVRPRTTFKNVIEKYGYPVIGKKQARMIHDLQNESERNANTCRLRRTGVKRDGSYSKAGKLADKWQFLADAPFKVSPRCCEVLKREPFTRYESESGRKPMTAVMADESETRRASYLRDGCFVFDGKCPHSTPMAIWTEQDVLSYIVENGLEYAGCYGEIIGEPGSLRCTRESRTGCMFCMFGIQFDGEPNRFQRMERDYPKQYDYCINTLGIGKVLDYIGIPYVYQPTLMEGR